MSYLTFKLISLAVLVVVALIVLVANRNSKQKTAEPFNNIDGNSEVNEFQLRKGLCHLEYTLIPIYVDLLKRNEDMEVKLVDTSYWEKDIASLTQPQNIDWDEFSCEIVGNMNSEFVILYEFPRPYVVPLAKYGAVYINKLKKTYNYYTLEKSSVGYMLSSTTKERHYNYGEKGDLSKEEFLKEICSLLEIDDITVQEWRLAKSKKSTKDPRYLSEQEKHYAEMMGQKIEQIDPNKIPEKQSENAIEKTEETDKLKKANREFTKLYLSLSEWEKNKIRGEDNPRTPEEEKAYWEEFELRKKEHYELLKGHPNNHHHCVGFDLPTATEAFEHFNGMLEELWDYGDMCNGHCLHTWDDGGRKLYLCHDCGGLVLVQKSEYHGQENDDYYTDYIPVDSAQEAERLNELYGGWAIEKEWKGKKVFVSNGHVTPNFR